MPLKYSCFINHCHGQHDLMKNFVTQIKYIFENCMEPYFDQEVYIDETRLQPGYHFNEELSQAICQSFCMITIYTPRYASHSYCLRELMAMKELEKKRLGLLENKSTNMGMIIPIILRDDPRDSPSKIRSEIGDEIHYCDFSNFGLTNMEIIDNPGYVRKVDQIAEKTYELYTKFEECGIDPCCECNSFRLPSEKDVEIWKGKSNKPITPFIWRGA